MSQSAFTYTLRLAYCTGMLPVKNSLRSKVIVKDLEFKLFSWHSLFSAWMLLYKSITLSTFVLLTSKYAYMIENPATSKNKVTDVYASSLAFFFAFCMGPFAHIFVLWRVPRFLDLLKNLDNYDKKYETPNSTTFKIGHVRLRWLMGFVSSVLFIYTPLYYLYTMASQASLNNDENTNQFILHIIPGVLETRNVPFICFYLNLGFIFLETGYATMQYQIFFTSKLLEYKFENLLLEACGNLKIALAEKSSADVCWESIGTQFNDLLNVLKKFQIFVGPYFVALLGVLITSSTCMIFFLLTSDSFIAVECRPVLIMIVIASLGRIYGFVERGEVFLRIHKKLIMEVITCYQKESSFSSANESQINSVVKLITSSPVHLSASGFFVVSRKNITSIVSVIITYIVVLLQFSNSGARYGIGLPNGAFNVSNGCNKALLIYR